jgi:uncharacterized cofD-like protein
LIRGLKWLAPGMNIKRWIWGALLGLVSFTLGVLLAADFVSDHLRAAAGNLPEQNLFGLLLVLTGLLLMVFCTRRFFHTLNSAAAPYGGRKQLVEVLYDRRYLDQGLKIVAIGGGTGLSTLLRGLKVYSSNLVGIVTVSDDGGSSGRLRKDMGILAPGDIRNCLVALADDESLMAELFRFRFKEGGLEGHSFGNLFLAALTELAGDFEVAVNRSSQILAIRGQVLPATLAPVTLTARYRDGSQVRGESAIPARGKPIERVSLEPADCQPPAQVLLAIAHADAIVLGPGSLYTSLIPNLLVTGVGEAIRKSSAPKIYVCNVMTQPGETDLMGAADHVEALLSHCDIALDYVVVNLADPAKLRDKYRAEGADPVDPQLERISEMGIEGVGANLISETDLVRHDPERLSRTIVDLIARHRSKDVPVVQREPVRLRAVK